MTRVAALLAAVLATALGLAACGGEDGAEPGAPSGASAAATLVLDFQPNAVHAPLYAAQGRGYFADAGLELQIREPSSTADGAKLLEAGRADFAILDLNDFGIARERGMEIVAVAAIVQRPLAAVIAGDSAAVANPRDLEGASVGVTGVPSDEAVLDTVLASAGLEPDAVDRVTIGFASAPALASGRVAAATAFWNAEGVELRQQGVGTREFRVDEFGAPRYPELVLATRGEGAPEDAELSCSLLEGIGLGYRDLADDPQSVVEEMLEQVEGLDPDSQRAQFAELVAADAFSPRDDGLSDPSLTARSTEAWAEWASESGVLAPDAARFLEGAFVPDEVRRCATVPAGTGTGAGAGG